MSIKDQMYRENLLQKKLQITRLWFELEQLELEVEGVTSIENSLQHQKEFEILKGQLKFESGRASAFQEEL